MKNIAFNVEGYIKVPDNATKEEIEEALRFYFMRLFAPWRLFAAVGDKLNE